VAEGGGALRELLAHFEVEVEDEKLDKFEEHMEHFKHTLEKVGEVLVEVFAIRELKEFVAGSIEMGATLVDTSNRLGITTDELQKFQFAASLSGVSSEAAAHSLGLFQRKLGEASEGGGDMAATMKKIGVSLKETNGTARPTLDILEDVADHMKAEEDPAKRSALAMKLFGRAGLSMIPMLREGGEGVRELYEEFDQLGGGMGEDFVKQAKKVDDELKKLKVGWLSLKTKIVAEVLPVLQDIVDALKTGMKWIMKVTSNTHLFRHALELLTAGGIIGGIWRIVAGMAAMGVEGMLMALPWILLAGAIVAAVLLFDDFMTMMEGGDSVIGDALGPDKTAFILQMRDAMVTLKQAWDEFWNVAVMVAGALWSVDKALEPLGTVTSVKDLARDFEELVRMIASAAENIASLVKAAVALKNGKFSDALAAVANTSVGRLVTQGPSAPTQYAVQAGFNQAAGLPAPALPERPKPATTADVMSTIGPNGLPLYANMDVKQSNTINVTVNHTGDESSDELGKRVGGAAQKELDAKMLNALNAVKTK